MLSAEHTAQGLGADHAATPTAHEPLEPDAFATPTRTRYSKPNGRHSGVPEPAKPLAFAEPIRGGDGGVARIRFVKLDALQQLSD